MAEALRGVGIGWRPEISGVIAALPGLGFCEIIAESIAPVGPPRGVTELRERGVQVVPHGVRLSLGGTEPVEPARVTHLAACAAAVGAPLVSEHVAFVRAGGRDAGHLLPVPRTREALDVLTANVARMQAELDVPLALEPIAALFDWPDDELSEADFLTELLERTGALLLLDVANVHANAVNRGIEPVAALDRMPLDRVAYVHVAGGALREGLYHDTHTDPVPPAVLGLLDDLCARLDEKPPVMLERDGHYPPAPELRAELAAIATAAHHPRVGTFPRARRDVPPRETRSNGTRVGVTRQQADPTLAARQAALVAALAAGGPAPTRFDVDRLDATRRALLRNRADGAATVWPVLAASLHTDWNRRFVAHLDGREPVGPLRDGWDLARELHRNGMLDPGATAELAAREATLRYDGRSQPRVRWAEAARRKAARGVARLRRTYRR